MTDKTKSGRDKNNPMCNLQAAVQPSPHFYPPGTQRGPVDLSSLGRPPTHGCHDGP